MQRTWKRLPLLLAAALAVNLLVPAAPGPGVGRASAAGTDPYWAGSESILYATSGTTVMGNARNPDATPDGRYIAFDSDSVRMDPRLSGQEIGKNHIYVYDRLTGKTELIDAVGPETDDVANESSYEPSISDDGTRIAFHSMATNLVDQDEIASTDPDSVDNFERVYVYDRTTHEMTLASANEFGEPANYYSHHAAISGDGRTVVFESEAGNLAGGPDEYMYNWQIYARHLDTNETTLVSDPAAGSAYQPAINADGGVIAYVGMTYQYEESRFAADIYRYRASAGERERVTDDTAYSDSGDYGYASPALSADGERVVFQSSYDTLPGDANGHKDIVLYAQNGLTIVSRAEDGTQGDQDSYMPDISPDGRYVGFVSEATNLRPGLQFDSLFQHRVSYWYDSQDGTLTNLGGLEHAANGWTPSVFDGGFAYEDGFVGLKVAIRDGGELPSWTANKSLTLASEGGGIRLSWTANEGADVVGYKIFESRPDPLLGSYYTMETLLGYTTETSYLATNPPEDRTGLSYRVEAVNGRYQTSGDGPAAAFGSDGDDVPPVWGEGSALEVRAVSSSGIALGWSEASDNTAVASYKLYRNDPAVPTAGYSVVAETAAPSAKDEGLLPDTEYSYYVTAVDPSGNESEPLPAVAVRTLAEADPQGGELSAEAQANGDVKLVWTAGEGVARYEVWDVTEEGNHRKLTETDGGGTDYTVTGLEPSATYRFEVVGYDADDLLVYRTLPAEVAAAGIEIASVAVSRDNVFGGIASAGSEETVTVTGQPGRTAVANATYTTWYAEDGQTLLDTPREATGSVPMAEDPQRPGVYTGTFAFAEGIDKLLKLEAKLVDGGGRESSVVSAPNLPIANSAGLRLSIHSTDSMAGYKLNVYSPSLANGQTKRIESDDASFTVQFDRLRAVPDVRLRVLSASGKLVQEVSGIELRSGFVAEKQLELVLTKKLSLTLRDDKGQPVAGQLVSLIANNGVYRSAVTDSQGLLPATDWIPDTEYVVASVPGLPTDYEPFADQRIALDSTSIQRDLELKLRKKSVLTGTLLNWNGQPFAGAGVEVSQQVDDRLVTNNAYADAQGHYSLQAFSGTAKLAFSGTGAEPETMETNLSAEGSVQDYRFEKSMLQQVKLNLYTKYGGGPWQGPLPIDWTTGIHLGITVNGTLVTSDVVTVAGKPGDKVRVAANGDQARLQSDAKEVVLEEDGYTEVDLRLQQGGNLSATLKLPDSWDGYWTYWSSTLSKHQEDGSWSSVGSSYGFSRQLEMGVPGSGRYKLTVRSEQGSASREFDSDGASDIALGELALHEDNTFFEGKDGNELSAFPRKLAPGQTTKVRLAYEAAGTAPNARLLLDVPAGTELAAGTVTLNGQTAAYQAEDGRIVLAVGSLAQGDKGSVSYELRLLDAAGGTLPVAARVEYDGNGAKATETLGSFSLSGAPLTLSAPASAENLDWKLSGEGPAGATVVVYASGAVLGRTVVGPGGYWKLDATAPDPQGAKVFNVYAESEWSGTTVRSETAEVRYDPDQPMLKQLTIEQADGRRVALDVSKGPVRFPYVVVPGSTFRFEATFAQPEKVENVKIVIQTTNGAISAAATERNGVFYASMPPGYGMSESVYVTYDRKGDTGPKEIADMASFKTELPPAMRDYAISSQQEFAETDDGTLKGSVDLTLPQVRDMGMHVDLELQRDSGYVPTDEDLRQAEALGVEAYGVTADYARDGDEIRVAITAYVPEDQVGNLSEAFGALAAAPAPKTKGKEIRVASLASNLVKVTVNTLWNEKSVAGQLGKGGASIYDTKSAVDGRGQVADNMKELGNLADQIAKCNPAMAGYYGQRIEQAATHALSVEAAKWGMMIAGAVLAPATFGGSLALMGLSMGIGAALDATVNHQMDQLKDAVNKSSSAKCDPQPEGSVTDIHLGSPAAQPVWIYDPSGYVYETFPDNRIEGATATVYQWNAELGRYEPWDAEWFGQANPQTTDALGKYGWDVPNGKWQVVYEKDGYETARSAELPVPPPQFDVNVPMVSFAPPRITEAKAETSDGGTTVTFLTDKYVAADALASGIVRVTLGGTALQGTVEAVDARTDDEGVSLTRTFRFVSAGASNAGDQLQLSVRGEGVVSYAGVAMESDYAADAVVAVKDTAAPVLVSSVADASGSLIELRFNELLDSAKPLAKTDFTLTGTPLTVKSASYGTDGQSVALILNGKLPAGVLPQLTIAADRLYDAGGNAFAGGAVALGSSVPSADAALSGLQAEGYSLSPAFQADRLSYELRLPEDVSTVRVKATARDAHASVRINGQTAGTDFVAATIVDESVVVAVTAEDGVAKRYYELTVVRGDAPSNPGTSSPPASSGGEAASQPVTSTNGTLEIPAGGSGTVSLGDGVTVAIPSGAMKTKFKITIAPLAQFPLPAESEGLEPASAAYEIDKDVAGTFDVPVELSLQLTGSPKAGQTAAIYYYDESAGRWTRIGGTVQEGVIRASTSHFTKFAAFYEAADESVSLTDIQGHWSEQTVREAVSLGLAKGYPDGSFKPNAAITRAEFAAMLARALKLGDAGTETAFADDASLPAWAKASVAALAKQGIVSGDEKGRFLPDRPITRAEIVTMVAKALKLETAADAATAFADDARIPAWAKPSAAAAAASGLVRGRDGNLFAPGDRATRAEAVTVLVALTKLANEKQEAGE